VFAGIGVVVVFDVDGGADVLEVDEVEEEEGVHAVVATVAASPRVDVNVAVLGKHPTPKLEPRLLSF